MKDSKKTSSAFQEVVIKAIISTFGISPPVEQFSPEVVEKRLKLQAEFIDNFDELGQALRKDHNKLMEVSSEYQLGAVQDDMIRNFCQIINEGMQLMLFDMVDQMGIDFGQHAARDQQEAEAQAKTASAPHEERSTREKPDEDIHRIMAILRQSDPQEPDVSPSDPQEPDVSPPDLRRQAVRPAGCRVHGAAVPQDGSMSANLADRLAASLCMDAINGDAHERAVFASQVREAVAALRTPPVH